MSDITCPTCGTELELTTLFMHADDQRALARLVAVSVPIGARVLQYVGLFTPPKQRLTAAKKIKLILQLLPDLEREAITHKGRDWPAPLASWGRAIEQMLGYRDEGRLELPMKGHAYLYSILVGMADKAEARAEQQAETERRTTPRRDTVQVRGQAMAIGAAISPTSPVQGAKDPALVKAEQAAQSAAPVPAAVRELAARLKGGPVNPTPSGDAA